MKRLAALAALLTASALMCGCSSISYYDNGFYSRYRVNDTFFIDTSMKPSVSYSPYSFGYPSGSNGQTKVSRSTTAIDLELGLGAGMKIADLKWGTLSAALRFSDPVKFRHSAREMWGYNSDGNLTDWEYRDSVRFEYFGETSYSLYFPEIEAQLPFARDLSIYFGVELVKVTVDYSGGYFTDNYISYRSTSGFDSSYDWSLYTPGDVVSTYYTFFWSSLANVKLGVTYKF